MDEDTRGFGESEKSVFVKEHLRVVITTGQVGKLFLNNTADDSFGKLLYVWFLHLKNPNLKDPLQIYQQL